MEKKRKKDKKKRKVGKTAMKNLALVFQSIDWLLYQRAGSHTNLVSSKPTG